MTASVIYSSYCASMMWVFDVLLHIAQRLTLLMNPLSNNKALSTTMYIYIYILMILFITLCHDCKFIQKFT